MIQNPSVGGSGKKITLSMNGALGCVLWYYDNGDTVEISENGTYQVPVGVMIAQIFTLPGADIPVYGSGVLEITKNDNVCLFAVIGESVTVGTR